MTDTPGARTFPPAEGHGEIEELFPDVFFVTGTVAMGGPVTMRFSRNMTILRQDGALTLVNAVRLTDAGLAALEGLGRVAHVIRLAAFHGMDDPFYRDRYGAKIWSVDAPYVPGLDRDAESYLTPDAVLTPGGDLPIGDAAAVVIASASPNEALLRLERDGGILISGDCLQNWAAPDRYFSFLAKIAMRLMGFFKPHNIGPAWRKTTTPDPAELKALLDLDFEHLLPAHGRPVIGNARASYKPAMDRL